MTQDKPAEWAMKAAREAYNMARPFENGRINLTEVAALAIEAADKAATERAAVVAEQFSQSAHIAYSMRSGDFPKIARIEDAIAAAIRKGGDND